MEKPTISIITVTYNCQDTLEETILSVINQTYSNIEYIVIDGGSTDGTVDIIKKYQDQISYWISEPDKGIYDAMNKGIDKATGVWVNFMNAGDSFFEKNTLNRVVLKMDDPFSLYYGDAFLLNLKKKYWGKFSSVKLAIGNICHQAIFYPKSVYRIYDYNLKFRVLADYYYNISIYPIIKFKYLDEIICNYDNQGMSTVVKDEEFLKVRDKLILQKLGLLPLICRILYSKLLDLKKIFSKN